MTDQTSLVGFRVVAILFLFLMGAFAWRVVLGRRIVATASSVFLILQFTSAIGLILAAGPGIEFSVQWVALTLTGLLMFILGAVQANLFNRFQPSREISIYRASPLFDDLDGSATSFLYFMTISVSIAVGFFFMSGIGYNTFAQGLREFLFAGSVTYSEFSQLRTGATRDTYVAAGYAVQFTAVVLPAIALLLYLRGRLNTAPIYRIAALALIVIDLAFITATGGRKYVLQVALSFFLILTAATGPLPRRLSSRRSSAFLSVILILAVFGAVTVLQGRLSTDSGGNFLTNSVASLYNRVSGDYSEQQLTAIQLLREEAPVWGDEWFTTLKSALPGPDRELTFDSRLHGLLFSGNTRGSAPLNVWGSIFYNWGLVGIMVVPLLMGFLLQSFTIRKLFRDERSLSRVVLISLAGYRLALWRDPYSLLLEGGLTLIAFAFIHRKVRGRRLRQSASGRPTQTSRVAA